MESRSGPPLAGVIPIMVTVFGDDDRVDIEGMDRQVEFLIDAGVHWAGFGFGSEVNRLGAAELDSTVAHVVATAGDRMSIFGNAELRSVAGGIEQVRRVEQTGAQLALVRPSSLDGVSQDELFETFAAVAEGGGVPIIVQDAPQNTAVQLSALTLARLLVEARGVAAVKIEPANPALKIESIVDQLAGAPGVIIGGAGGLEYLHELDRGACGTMPGPAHPELFAAMHRLHDKGDRRQAFELFAQALPLLELCKRDMDTFLFVQKYVLVRRGVLKGARLGHPHRDMDPRLQGEIDEIIEHLALLELFERCRDVAG
jgi:4-hydroxy-tetrahydrodipicolinate synthase